MSDEFPLIPGMIDSHFHYIELVKKGLEPEKLFPAYFDSGLAAAVDISTGIVNHEKRLQFALGFKNIYISSGISPGKAEHQVDEIETMLSTLESQIAEGKESSRVVAVGETGLDWHWKYGTREKQLMLLEKQIDLAAKYNLPVIIHNREADRDILEVIKRKKPSRGGVIHCFSSNYHFASSCIDAGFYISFAGNVTYKKNTEIQEAAKKIPSSSILVETDAPYLSPQKVRSLPNTPGYISHTYNFLSESRGEDNALFINNVKNNFNRLFGLEV